MNPIVYQCLTVEEQHEMLLNTLIAQEHDHYTHCINQERFETILADSSLDMFSDFAFRIQQLLADTIIRRREVELILRALWVQLPSQEDMRTAMERLKGKGVLRS